MSKPGFSTPKNHLDPLKKTVFAGGFRVGRPLGADLGPAQHADAGGDDPVGLVGEPHLRLAVLQRPRRHPLRQQERQDLRPQRKQDRQAAQVGTKTPKKGGTREKPSYPIDQILDGEGHFSVL